MTSPLASPEEPVKTPRMKNASSTSLMRLGLALLLLASSGRAAHADAEHVLGRYWLPEREGQFEFYRKGERFFARVISYDVVGQLDEKNEDPGLRSRPFVGIDMFAEFRYDEDVERWVDGTVYDARSGKTYDGYLWFEEDEPGVLYARGFVGFSFVGRTETFERVEAE